MNDTRTWVKSTRNKRGKREKWSGWSGWSGWSKRWRLATALAAAAVAVTAVPLAPPVQATAVARARTVSIAITDHGFMPGQVITLLNQNVTLQVTNKGRQMHEFSIPHYSIYSRNLPPGQKTTITFAPWTAGRFDMMSDPSGDNTPEFTGQFVVTDQK